MIKAIAFDMDDTLLPSDRKITPYTIDVLRRAAARGIRIIPASGRAIGSMKSFTEQIGCAAAIVTYNGAELFSGDGQLLFQEAFSVEQARRCAKFAEDAGVYVQCYFDDHFYYSGTQEWATAYASSSMLTGTDVGSLSAFIYRPTCKVLAMAEETRVAELIPLAQEKIGDIATISCSKPYFLEMNPARATKGNALAWLADHWGLTADEFMTFGDSLNDVSMLTWAGRGVAMANARDDVKAQVREVCGSNDEDGVARYIEAQLL